MAFFSQGKVRLQSRKLTESTVRYPDIVGALRQLHGEAVLDGEIIAVIDGKPSFEKVLERELVSAPEKVAIRARQYPAIFVAFDILYLNGRELLPVPLLERRQLLSELVSGCPTDAVVESTYILEHGLAYFQEAADRGLEGIVAKRLDSPYVPGKRTSYWIKIKVQRTLDCVVLGTIIEPETGRVKSLVLGAYREKQIVWLGNVGSGLDTKTLEGLANELGSLECEAPEGISVSAPGEIRWLSPALVARVKYLELTREGRLRAPVFVGFVDARPETCKAPDNRPE
jgi:ATP-dependent DNA ligase